MNADRLLHTFSLIGDSPEHIRLLRRMAVALAIADKLGKSDIELTATAMLETLESVKASLYRQKKISKPKNLPSVAQEDLPDNFPKTARFVPLGALARVEKGLTGIKQASPGIYPLVVTGAKRASCDHFDFDEAAAIIPLVSSTGHGHASINRLHYQDGQFALGTILAAVIPYDKTVISARFVFEYLSAFKDELLVSRMTGTANVTLTVGRILEIPVPLVSPATQAQLDKLMVLLDRLEAARERRETTRDRLTTASLARLTASETSTEDFPAHARFALDTLPALTTRPDQIKQLRQTILNLAVRGKLVEQDPSEEPASKLLKQLAIEKDHLLKAKKIPRQKPLLPLSDKDIAFELPKGWTWVRLGALSQFVTSGSRDWAKYYSTEGPIFVRMGNLSKDHYRLRLGQIQRVKPPSGGEGTRTSLEPGDILISITGDVGMLGLIPEDFGEAYINQHTAMIRPMPGLQGRYLPELFRSPFAQDQFNAPQRGIKNSFRLTDVTQLALPLPPLAEQHRIVEKVDALMALCDRLEAALVSADTTRAKLLDALLHEALAQPETQQLEAAE